MHSSTDTLFAALADPTRRGIFQRLSQEGELTVRALTAPSGISQPAVSKHLSVLRQVGIVSVTKQGQMRMYRLEPAKLKPVHDWVTKYERYWSHQLDRIRERAERRAKSSEGETK